ncbi:hypothetical protein WDV06_03735 [Streptomyces racemochromogenes]|uniref:Uncharacterized protein n=1 Tax=Streptomyces racemochromogenes TaxID=67353 RepID=A0ABW7P788_9ACTN
MGGEGAAARRGVLAPVLANLALGVPAVVPLYLGWWVLTEYLPMDCHSTADLAKPDLGNCDFHTLDHSTTVLFLLVVTGVLLVGAVFVVDAVLPSAARRGTWLRSAALVPVPFALLLACAYNTG